MNTSRTRILRISIPVAAALLALSACSSTSAEDPSSGSTAAEAAASEPMDDEPMDDEPMDDEPMEDEPMDDEPMDEPMAGAFIDYADYEAGRADYDAGTVVLFFNATWCSTCQETVENLTGDPDSIPAGLTIVSVDYDSADALRQQYGITTQHTFVQVDADGTELAKWSGSTDAEAIAKKTT